jgi:hypothetical protein
MEEIFKNNGIDSIVAFVQMSDVEVDSIGLNTGQKKKCLEAINYLTLEKKKSVSAYDI